MSTTLVAEWTLKFLIPESFLIRGLSRGGNIEILVLTLWLGLIILFLNLFTPGEGLVKSLWFFQNREFVSAVGGRFAV